MTGTCVTLLLVLAALSSTLAFLVDRQGRSSSDTRRRSGRDAGLDQCAMITRDPGVAREEGTAYIELGTFSLLGDIDISLDVLPDREIHDGPLFAVGTSGFKHFLVDVLNTQFLIIEFSYSALSLAVKAVGEQYLTQFELFKTFPHPYRIDDGQWHHIRVIRDSAKKIWKITLDNNTRTDPVTTKTDVQMHNLPAYMGGRPDYNTLQFNGVIKNLLVNNQPVVLTDRRTFGEAEAWHCTAPPIIELIQQIQRGSDQSRHPFQTWDEFEEQTNQLDDEYYYYYEN